ncbi:hypothetical protein KGM_203214 [Danaus plexippus plexippus]|uniref:Uncharacterized protein n=1 Tax=Danaus plexippus plexippus TaxID=278856 RepID=A0A212FJL6_DANPL|nr:hypothetical protein KGM_203214 [Danaus plexippus plexippus]
MRVCCVTVLAALALRTAAESAPRRFPTEWRAGRELQIRSRPLQEIFEPDSGTETETYTSQHEMHKDRRRMRNNKRALHIPAELASQMMLRASRSGRPYDVPQIVGKILSKRINNWAIRIDLITDLVLVTSILIPKRR